MNLREHLAVLAANALVCLVGGAILAYGAWLAFAYVRAIFSL